MLVKYAAKRTWPEKSAAWEHQGEAETAQAFAVEFATIEQLGVDVEFLVMAREGDGEIQFFRVVSTSPCQILPAEPRTGGAAAPAAAQIDAADDAPAPIAISLSPVISMMTYMGKVAVMAIVVIGVLAFVMKYIRSLLGG